MSGSSNGSSKITVIGNFGDGGVKTLSIDAPLTVGEVMERIAGANGGEFKFRVNGAPATSETLVNPNDQVSATPAKVDGACR